MLRGGRAFIFRRNERSTSPGMGVQLRRNTHQEFYDIFFIDLREFLIVKFHKNIALASSKLWLIIAWVFSV